MAKTRIISVLNQKGGVGKTTTTLNLSHGLALKGYEVLVIDLDPQAQLTNCLGMVRRDVAGIERALLHAEPLINLTYPMRDNLRLVPAGAGLGDVETLSEGGANRGRLLRDALQGERGKYHFILLDCPPSSSLLAVNAIFASDEILIPMTGDYLALQGMAYLMGTLRNFEKALGHKLKQWVVMSRFQPKRRLSQDVLSKLIEHFPGRVLQTQIGESVMLAESPSFGKSIFEYKPTSKPAQEYETLVEDLLLGRVFQ
jgi:chromosome partitioning protein